MSRSVEVKLAGQTLHIQTDDDPKRVLAAADLVQQQLDMINQSGVIVDSKRTMLLVALNLADDLLSQQQASPQVMQKLKSKLDQAIVQAEGLASVSLR